ncbi:DUF3817 domain-containing protein [Corynebacterium sp. 335C]
MTPKSLYRVLATAEMVTWALLLGGMFLKYAVGAGELGVRIGGGVHGLTFLTYCVVTVLTWVNQRWDAKTGVLGLASSIVPFATLPFDKWVDRRGLLEGDWRYRNSVERPSTLPDRVLALYVRYPLSMAIVTLLGVAVVFGLLLMAGPPTEWFA